MAKVEKRYMNTDIAEFRTTGTEGGMKIEGLAAVYNRWSEDIGFKEIIRPGAFTEALENGPDVRLLLNHDPNHVLARTTNNTLRLSETDKGLQFEADIINTQIGRDSHTMVKAGLINQCSFAFTVAKDGDKWEGKSDHVRREITKIDGLYDVSCVTYPAYSATGVSARSVYEDVGIEIDRLTAALIRAQHGGITYADHDVIEASISTLRSLQPKPVEQEGEAGELVHSATDGVNRRQSLLMQRRRLEIVR